MYIIQWKRNISGWMSLNKVSTESKAKIQIAKMQKDYPKFEFRYIKED